MKKIILTISLIIILLIGMLTLTGCTLKIETSENSVSASVDGETSEKVDGVIDWIKERISRVFNTTETSNTTSTSTSEKI